MNGKDVSLVNDGIKMKSKVYAFSKGFLMFITNKDVTEKVTKCDENKIKQFQNNIGYKQRGDTKSNRSKLMRKMLASIGEPTFQVISRPTKLYRRDTSDYEQAVVEEEEEEETDARLINK